MSLPTDGSNPPNTTTEVVRKRGRPIGSKNATSTKPKSASSSKKTGRAASSKNSGSDSSNKQSSIPSVRMLSSMDVEEIVIVGDDDDDEIVMDEEDPSHPSGAQMIIENESHVEATMKESKRKIAHMYNNLHGHNPFDDSTGNDDSNQQVSIDNNNSHSSKLERMFIPHSSSFVVGEDIWPSTTTKPCRHCRRRFNHTPVMHARSADLSKLVFKDIYGNWCSPQCKITWLEERNVPNIGHDILINVAICRHILGMTIEECSGSAPPSESHVNNDGPFSEEEFIRMSSPKSWTRVVQVDQTMLVPSVLLFEVTTKRREDNAKGVSLDHPSSEESKMHSGTSSTTELPALMTRIGVEMNPDDGKLYNMEPSEDSVQHRMDDESAEYLIGDFANGGNEKPLHRYKVRSYGYHSTYEMI